MSTDRTLTETNRQHHLMDPLEDFFRHDLTSSFGGFRDMPQSIRMDVIAKEKEVLINAEVPGMNKENIKLHLDGDLLTISGEKHNKVEEKGTNFLRREISSGSTSRSIRLPDGCDVNKLRAKYDNGMLHITMPRVTNTKEAIKHDIKIE